MLMHTIVSLLLLRVTQVDNARHCLQPAVDACMVYADVCGFFFQQLLLCAVMVILCLPEVLS
jgi:hypothetical protein